MSEAGGKVTIRNNLISIHAPELQSVDLSGKKCTSAQLISSMFLLNSLDKTHKKLI